MTRTGNFKKRLIAPVSFGQDRMLENEVSRRREMIRQAQEENVGADVQAIVSPLAAAHGGNLHVNKGMLIREAIEKTFGDAA